MQYTRRKSYWFVLLSILLLIRCATDPGTSTPVVGGAITFTQATGQVRVVSSVEGTSLTTAVVLFDTNLSTGTLGEATLIEEGVTVIWPEALWFELPDCTARPILLDSTSYTTSKIFRYAYPDACTPAASSEVAAQAVVIITKNGTTATVTDTTVTAGGQTFTTSGTWTAPSGVTSVTVECWGGGGGGGSYGGEGGGGGAYSRKTSIPVTPGASYTVNVGNGGVGGLNSNNTYGVAGGATWFSTQGTVLARGGSGGAGDQSSGSGLGGLSGTGIGDTRYSGGNGSAGFFGSGGGGGSSAGLSSNGVNAVGHLGGIAPIGGGNGGDGNGGNSTTNPGGGGSGSALVGGSPGSSGASGQVIVSWN